jgi:gas vesicle protein
MEKVSDTAGPARSSDNLNTVGPGGASSFLLGVLTGVAVAGVLTLLYAPKSGPETRNLLKDEYCETQRMLQRWSNDIRERITRLGQVLSFSASQEVQTAGNGHREEDNPTG